MACANLLSMNLLSTPTQDLREGERFAELLVDNAVLVRVEVSNLRDLLDLLNAPRIEHVQCLYRLVVRDEALDTAASP